MRIAAALALWSLVQGADEEAVLFDFESGVEDWRSVTLAGVGGVEPDVRAEASEEHAASGRASLKLTFDGGFWPAVSTGRLPVEGTWAEFQTLKAVVTVRRPAYIGFRALQESGPPEGTWNRTAYVEPGRNEIEVLLHDSGRAIPARLGKVTGFQIYAYKPAKGEVVHIDAVRLCRRRPAIPYDERYSPLMRNGFSIRVQRQYLKDGALQTFRVAGTDEVVKGVDDLAARRAAGGSIPPERTLEDEEADFRTKVEAEHPRAAVVSLRDGENGFAGWRDTWITCHGPDGPFHLRTNSHGKKDQGELFMRHRSLLFRVDLSGIPAGSKILAARFLLVRTEGRPRGANLVVAEPARVPWDEDANGYEYSPGKLWKAVSGLYYGEDGDFDPVYLAHGFTGGPALAWDFTHAVRYWVEEGRPNHGFMLHGQKNDYLRVHLREAAEVRKRPALLVAYAPPP